MKWGNSRMRAKCDWQNISFSRALLRQSSVVFNHCGFSLSQRFVFRSQSYNTATSRKALIDCRPLQMHANTYSWPGNCYHVRLNWSYSSALCFFTVLDRVYEQARFHHSRLIPTRNYWMDFEHQDWFETNIKFTMMFVILSFSKQRKGNEDENFGLIIIIALPLNSFTYWISFATARHALGVSNWLIIFQSLCVWRLDTQQAWWIASWLYSVSRCEVLSCLAAPWNFPASENLSPLVSSRSLVLPAGSGMLQTRVGYVTIPTPNMLFLSALPWSIPKCGSEQTCVVVRQLSRSSAPRGCHIDTSKKHGEMCL